MTEISLNMLRRACWAELLIKVRRFLFRDGITRLTYVIQTSCFRAHLLLGEETAANLSSTLVKYVGLPVAKREVNNEKLGAACKLGPVQPIFNAVVK